MLGLSCAQPDTPVGATEGATGSSEGGGSVTTAPGESSDGEVPTEPGPGRTTGFRLPEGCGDGVIVEGQYDCHYPVLLDDAQAEIEAQTGADEAKLLGFVVWDMNGDGDDELVVETFLDHPEENRKTLVSLAWNAEGFEIGSIVDGEGLVERHWTTSVDFDRDGQQDLVHVSQSVAFELYRGRGNTMLSQLEYVFSQPVGFDLLVGNSVLVDPDGDGAWEVLAAHFPWKSGATWRELVTFRREGEAWIQDGTPIYPPGCGVPAQFGRGDFNEDGIEDVAVFDHAWGCDPYAIEYDPEFHSVAVLLTDPVAGRLVEAGSVPIGAMSHIRYSEADDFDGDGHIDLLAGTRSLPKADSEMTGVAFMRGHGDGTFDDGLEIELAGVANTGVQGRADLDGDGDLDWILAGGDTIVDDLFAGSPEVTTINSNVVGLDGGPFDGLRALGDFNGDSVADYVSFWRDPKGDVHRVAMLSAP